LFRAVLDAWATPVKAVGTEPKMALNAERIVDSGVLEGIPNDAGSAWADLIPKPQVQARIADAKAMLIDLFMPHPL